MIEGSRPAESAPSVAMLTKPLEPQTNTCEGFRPRREIVSLTIKPSMRRSKSDARKGASRVIASAMANTDPREAIAWADTLAEPAQSQAALSEAVSTWANTDSYECSQWIAGLPEGTRRDHATASMINRIVNAEPDSAWQWAKTIREPELRKEALTKAFSQMQSQDPQTADALLNDAGLSQGDVDQLMNTL